MFTAPLILQMRCKTNHKIYFHDLKQTLEKFFNQYNTKINNDFSKFLNKNNYRIIGLPKKRNKYTVLTSPHVNKTAREQFESCIYTYLIQIELGENYELYRDFIFYIENNTKGVQVTYNFIKQ
jgi:ribosomal protein S10